MAAGIFYGLAFGWTLIFAKHHPFWCLFLTAAVSLVLIRRLKKHWRAQNWPAFCITFPAAFFAAGFPASLIWIVIIGDNDPPLDFIDKIILLFSFLSGLMLTPFYLLVTKLWQNSRLAQAIEQTKRGARVLTNLNEDSK